MAETPLTCPQCGLLTDELFEGYCEECCKENQRALDAHNAEYDRWQRLSDSQRDDEIKKATQ